MSQDSVSQVLATQREWLTAMAEKDISQLLSMVTDDILVVHPNGKTVRGSDELRADFSRFFDQFELQQSSESEETVIAGEWGFNISKISSTLFPKGSQPSKQIDSIVFSLLKYHNGRWLIARVISVILP